MTTPTRKTDEEIRERIKHHQAAVEEEEDYGDKGNEVWCEAMTAIRELQWVLGE